MSARHVRVSFRAVVLGTVLGGVLSVLIVDFRPAPALAQGAATEEWKAPARAARKKNPVPVDEKSLAAGKVVYVKECLSCHGTGGKGDGPNAKDLNPKPYDLNTAKVWSQTDGALFWKLTEGKKPMPAYDTLLSEEQRWQVINYSRATFGPKGAAK